MTQKGETEAKYTKHIELEDQSKQDYQIDDVVNEIQFDQKVGKNFKEHCSCKGPYMTLKALKKYDFLRQYHCRNKVNFQENFLKSQIERDLKKKQVAVGVPNPKNNECYHEDIFYYDEGLTTLAKDQTPQDVKKPDGVKLQDDFLAFMESTGAYSKQLGLISVLIFSVVVYVWFTYFNSTTSDDSNHDILSVEFFTVFAYFLSYEFTVGYFNNTEKDRLVGNIMQKSIFKEFAKKCYPIIKNKKSGNLIKKEKERNDFETYYQGTFRTLLKGHWGLKKRASQDDIEERLFSLVFYRSGNLEVLNKSILQERVIQLACRLQEYRANHLHELKETKDSHHEEDKHIHHMIRYLTNIHHHIENRNSQKFNGFTICHYLVNKGHKNFQRVKKRKYAILLGVVFVVRMVWVVYMIFQTGYKLEKGHTQSTQRTVRLTAQYILLVIVEAAALYKFYFKFLLDIFETLVAKQMYLEDLASLGSLEQTNIPANKQGKRVIKENNKPSWVNNLKFWNWEIFGKKEEEDDDSGEIQSKINLTIPNNIKAFGDLRQLMIHYKNDHIDRRMVCLVEISFVTALQIFVLYDFTNSIKLLSQAQRDNSIFKVYKYGLIILHYVPLLVFFAVHIRNMASINSIFGKWQDILEDVLDVFMELKQQSNEYFGRYYIEPYKLHYWFYQNKFLVWADRKIKDDAREDGYENNALSQHDEYLEKQEREREILEEKIQNNPDERVQYRLEQEEKYKQEYENIFTDKYIEKNQKHVQKVINDRLDLLIERINFEIDIVQKESINSGFTFLGVAVTYQLLSNMFRIFGGLVASYGAKILATTFKPKTGSKGSSSSSSSSSSSGSSS